jgi:hypothetical protein
LTTPALCGTIYCCGPQQTKGGVMRTAEITFTPLNLNFFGKTFRKETPHLFRNNFIGLMSNENLEKAFSKNCILAGLDLEFFKEKVCIRPLDMESMVTVNDQPLLDDQEFCFTVSAANILKIGDQKFCITVVLD